jgi:hypothetical protein
VKPISGISIKLPENFCIDLAMLKQAKIHKPEPETGPREKSKLVVSGGVYGSTYSNTTPEEKSGFFVILLKKRLRTLKRVISPKCRIWRRTIILCSNSDCSNIKPTMPPIQKAALIQVYKFSSVRG